MDLPPFMIDSAETKVEIGIKQRKNLAAERIFGSKLRKNNSGDEIITSTDRNAENQDELETETGKKSKENTLKKIFVGVEEREIERVKRE